MSNESATDPSTITQPAFDSHQPNAVQVRLRRLVTVLTGPVFVHPPFNPSTTFSRASSCRRVSEVTMRFSRKAVLFVALLLVAAPCAHAQSTAAADQPSAPKTSAVPPRTPTHLADWTGFYAGANIGHASATFAGPISFAAFTTTTGLTIPTNTVPFNTSGGSLSAGGQVGYNVAVRNLITGIETTFNIAKPSGNMVAGNTVIGTGDFIPTDSFTASSSWNMSIRGRVGGVTHGTLIYATAGIAFSNLSISSIFPATGVFPAAAGTDAHTVAGATFGFGAEHAIRKNIIIGAEYSHTSFGSTSLNLGTVEIFTPPTVNEPAIGNIKMTTNEFGIRINFRLK